MLGVAAYGLWGLVPVFWPLLAPAAPLEVLAHRVLWTLVFMAGVLALLGGWGMLRSLPLRSWALIGLAAALVAANWGLFIYAVSVGQVVEVALGYYICPLASVLLGVLVLGERMRPAQWVAIAVATTAVLVIAIGDGRVPWLGLGLAWTFAIYGLIKKTVPLPATASLTAEGVVLAPVAAAYLVALQLAGTGTLTGHGAGHVALLLAAGPVTAIPLLLYGASARRIPLSTVGMLQYLAPTIQFLLGLLVFGEAMPPERWAGFGLVWLALVLFTVGLIRSRPRRPSEGVVAAAELH
jgi:chloramphenicol-sensitive protein RarD